MISLNALFCSIICDGMVQSVFVESLMHHSPIMTQKKKIEYLRNVGGGDFKSVHRKKKKYVE